MTIGFIGLGNMGAPMAACIGNTGISLVIHDRERDKAEPLLAAGASWADSPRECAEAATTVITSLPGPHQIEAVMRGGCGVLAGLREGATWIDMTTNRPELVRALAEEAAAVGVQTIEAPVTGAVDGARHGKLTIFVGGDTGVVDGSRTILESMGRIIHTGPLGTGNIVKLVTNQLWFIHAAAIGEGLVLGVRGGVDAKVLWEAIKQSVGNSFVAEHDVPSVFAGHYDPSFTLDLCIKDLGLIRELSENLDVPLELTAKAEALFASARETYGGDKGELHVVRRLEDAVAVSLRVPGDWTPPWK